MRHAILLLTLALMQWLAGPAPLHAQPLTALTRGAPLTPDQAFVLEARPDGQGGARLDWQIAPGYYLYREFLTAIDETGASRALETPEGLAKDDLSFGSVEVYYDHLSATLPQAGGRLQLTYQGCQDGGLCYPPKTVTLEDGVLQPGDQVRTGSFGADWQAQSADADAPKDAPAQTAPLTATPQEAASERARPAATPPDSPAATPPAATPPLALDAGEGGIVSDLSSRGGPLLVLAGFLGFGLLLAFTPCVFPMLPIVLGMLGGAGKSLTAGRGLALTGSYVLAMASAYGLLGVAAAWSGRNLQLVLQSPAVIVIIAAVFVLLSLSMFGLFELQLPAGLRARLMGGTKTGASGGSLWGAAALGFTSALIVGPCVTAPLAGALIYIAQTADVALGAGALFALGLGQGLPLLAIGVLGARALPRSGAWMVEVKRIFGLFFLGMAVYLLARLLQGPAVLALWAVSAVALGVFAGGFDRLEGDAPALRRLGTAFGLVAIMAGALLAVGAASGADDPLRPLARLAGGKAEPAPEAAFARVTTVDQLHAALDAGPAAGAPAMVYVTADWCVTCRGIERNALRDPAVLAALEGVQLVKADISDFGGDAQAMLDELGAVGPPTMLFLTATRAEPAGSRLIGDVSAPTLVATLDRLRSASGAGERAATTGF